MITWTGIEIIKQSRYANGSLGEGVIISANELSDDLMTLNMLLASWDTQLYANTKEAHTLTAGDADYTWGTGGNINTDRPIDLLDQTYILRGDISYPVRLVTQAVYNAVSNKTVSGLPELIFFDPQFPLAYIYLYPVPDAADALYLTSLKGISEITSATATVSLPQELAAALKWNLSVELAPNYNVPVTQVMAMRATETKGLVEARAFKYRMTPARIDNMTGRSRHQGRSILDFG